MKNDDDHFTIHDGGSEKAEMIANHTEILNGTKISTSTPRNQIFVILQTNGKNNASTIRVNAKVIKGNYDKIYVWYK